MEGPCQVGPSFVNPNSHKKQGRTMYFGSKYLRLSRLRCQKHGESIRGIQLNVTPKGRKGLIS